MSASILTREEVMASHAYARPQVEAGYKLHGGFDAQGRYHSPRTRNRWPAVRASRVSACASSILPPVTAPSCRRRARWRPSSRSTST